jgi:hypothetical protein
MIQSYFESVANSYQSTCKMTRRLWNAVFVARKHSLQQGSSTLGVNVVRHLRRVKVPINQSWAAAYFELQATHRGIAIDKRRKIYVLEDRNLEPSEKCTEAGVARYRRLFALFRSHRERNLAIGAVVLVALLALTFSNVTISASEKTGSPDASVVLVSPSGSVKAKCTLGADKAKSSAVAQKHWSSLGGVAYTHVTLRCQEKVAQYQVVKNLISGAIVSTKEVG